LQAGIHKSNLKVLYVGGTPDIDNVGNRPDSAVLAQSCAKRMASFEKMLKRYFRQVTVIRAKDYRPELSDNYDVTVMDGRPDPILPGIRERDSSGRLIRYEKPGYLPPDFDRPMLMIADMSEEIGRRIGLKTDWYCLCLDADAHHIRMEHPIFHGPFPVKMTMVKKPTPERMLTLPYIDGSVAPDSLPMWRVQKEGYISKRGTRVGMVSRPGGFEDSPEAEIISGGVSAKTWDAVAIGRHGNFLHWGFAASPDDMTEEARDVFANAIVYIAGFAGQTPIARKYDDRIITRHDIVLRAFSATRRAYALSVEAMKNHAAMREDLKQKAIEKQARGEKLDDMEQIALNYRPRPQASYEEQLQEYFPDLYKQFGADEEAYADYFHDNAPYFYPQDYGFFIDEDVRSLGIPNNDIRLLDKAISLWESGERIAKARRILTRYTLCRFTTPAEWRAWFEANKSRLFFTEGGGWLFLVDTRDEAVPGNDYTILQAGTEAALPERAQVGITETTTTDDRNPVAISAHVENLPGGNRLIVIKIKIHSGYHIYARVAETDPFITTEVKIDLPEGIETVGELQRPAGRVYNQAGTVVYEKEVVFRQEITGEAETDMVCRIGYQCCNETICMTPTEKKIGLK
jgi:hypothetical protein